MVATQTYSREAVRQILSEIKDPEIPGVSIEEIGMLRDIIVIKDACEVIITPTYTGCPAMGIIKEDILATLRLHGVPNPKVRMVYSPAWTTDWMSAATKEKLRQYGIAAPAHSTCSNWSTGTNVPVCCPRCNSANTKVISQFGSTACKAL